MATLDLVAFTPRTLTTKASLLKDLKRIRALGYATSFEERVVGAAGVAAPLFSGDTLVGGLSVSIPTSRAPLQIDSTRSAMPCASARKSSPLP